MPTIEREKLHNEIEHLARLHGNTRSGLIPILQDLQKKHGRITDEMMQETADRLNLQPMEIYSVISFYSFIHTEAKGKYVIRLCQTISCDMQGKDRIVRQMENELGIKMGETTPDGMFTLEYANCLGMCDQGPAMLINDKIYTHVTADKVADIIKDCRRGNFEKRNDMADVADNIKKVGPILEGAETPFAGLKKALELSRADLIKTIRDSGLKGRGGAGFPTALKWQIAAASQGDKKYVVCNADEGEPGTFKDRLLLKQFGDMVFDGMTIAGYAIGAKEGIVYLRSEYSFLKSFLEKKLEDRRSKGLLGEKVLGKEGFSFDIHIHMGAGAYICGEETALIESLEGKRGEPRNRPPFPVVVGLDGFPTVVNNVETFVDAALIVEKGPEWFKASGTEKTTGSKLMSVSGDCSEPGVYELPNGITVNELLKEVGGEGAKAVQVGGASGSCVPAKDFDRKITYEDVATGGSIIVFGKDRDMLDVAEDFLEFFVEESCGQCFLCRYGNPKVLEGLHNLRKGICSSKQLKDLQELGKSMQKSAKCGLGQSSANAFLSITENFADELLGRVPCN